MKWPWSTLDLSKCTLNGLGWVLLNIFVDILDWLREEAIEGTKEGWIFDLADKLLLPLPCRDSLTHYSSTSLL